MTDEILQALGVTVQYFGYSIMLYFMFETFALMWRMLLRPTSYN